MGDQSIGGNRNVQIQDVDRSLIEITYNEIPRTVPLEPAHVPVSARLPSPTRLVRAHAGVVPYLDRGELLENLENWIDTDEPFAGQIIGGRGGSGKTRLAVELCQALRKRSWLCGFLSRIADQAMLDALVQAPTARLVVIDYAESRVEQLELLLPLLKASATLEKPVRALLLMRTSPTQAKGWSDRLRNRVDSLDAVLDECDVHVLENSPLAAQDRIRLFEQAADAFAARIQATVPPAPDLNDEVFSSPLMIVIAAYLAVHGAGASHRTREDLLNEVLAHERRYWRNAAHGLDTDEALRGRMVALATLVNAESEDQAADLLRLLSDLEDAPAERRHRLARWVREQYPGPRWWNALEPDLVGEHLVAEAFSEQPNTLRKVLAGSNPDAITRPLEVLSRAAAEHAHLRDALRPIFQEALKHLSEVAAAQGETAQDRDLLYGNAVTAASALAAAIRVVKVEGQPLFDALDLLPERSNVVLNELAATLHTQYVDRCRQEEKSDLLAPALNNLSNRLANVGRHEEALRASEESVDIYRDLAKTDLATFGFLLAQSLNSLSNRLASAGRPDAALEAIEESVEIRRPLAAADPVTYGRYLAGALSSLSNRLAEAGRPDEALEAIEESVDGFRRWAAYEEPHLAMALNNLSNRLADAGRHEEALNAIEEASEYYRSLAKASPAGYGSDLASTLNNLSIRFAELNRYEEALEAIEESVELRRYFAAADPLAFTPALAGSLNTLSVCLARLGSKGKALEAIQEAVELHVPFATADPSAYGSDFVLLLANLRDRLEDCGRTVDAADVRDELARLTGSPPGKPAGGPT